MEDHPEEEKKLTKGQKKALKEKQKREAAAKLAEEGGVDHPTETPEPVEQKSKGPKGAKGKGKKGTTAAAAKLIKDRLEEKKREEEEKLREEELERLKAIEEEKILEAERKKRREQDKIKREIKRKEEEEEKEREEKERIEQARLNLINQGLIDPTLLQDNKDGQPNQKIKYGGKKKKNKNKPKKEDENQQNEGKSSTTDNINLSESMNTTKDMSMAKDSNTQDSKILTKQEIDNDLKMDDWEDLLDDDKIEQQVKVQVDEQPLLNTEKMLNELLTSEKVKTEKIQEDLEEEKVESKPQQKAKVQKDKENLDEEGDTIFDRAAAKRVQKNKKKKEVPETKASKKKDKEEVKFRCPIICVLGHVDTGKTLLLDKIRKTNVQKGEAGGITQQIGATYFPGEALQKSIDRLDDTFDCKEVKIPGLLVIDTPGHESFTNLRSRGSGLCDLAVLVVDIMHGLEPQTIESIELLKQKNTPFIVALNKIDRCHSWEKVEYRSSKTALSKQKPTVMDEYEDKRNKSFLQFNERGMNIATYWENDDDDYIKAVPTSAMTGEGIPDILGMIVKYTQTKLTQNVTEHNEEFQCTVLEVKKIAGVGTTVDVVLVNGKLTVGDTIVLAGFNGPIVTKIRALLTPQPMKEMRVKGEYIHHDFLYGAMGIKISAPDLDHALAGGELFKAEYEDQVEELCEEIQENMLNFAEKYVNASEEGVCVQASTLGSLEALLEFLKTSKISVWSVNIGTVFKKDVMKAIKFLDNPRAKKEYATILAFDVEIDPEAEEFAEEYGIKIFSANIIYHLFDSFTEYVKKCSEDRKNKVGTGAVFPCVIEIIDKDHIFRVSKPILIGVNVKGGTLKVGTPLWVPDKEGIKIGTVTQIRKGDKEVKSAKATDGGVSVRIEHDKHIAALKNFDHTNQIVSMLTRTSIDNLKELFRDEMTQDDWRLVKKLKEVLNIV